MAQLVYGQDAFTQLTANITTTPAAGTSETWAVISTGLPWVQITAGQQMPAMVAALGELSPEIVYITGIVDTAHFTVLRGQENTTPKIHYVGDTLGNNITAGVMNLLLTAVATPNVMYVPIPITYVMSPYTVTATSAWVEANATAGNIVVTTASNIAGFAFTLTKTDSSANSVTFTPPSGTVNGAASFVLTQQYDSVDLICNGSAWGLH